MDISNIYNRFCNWMFGDASRKQTTYNGIRK